MWVFIARAIGGLGDSGTCDDFAGDAARVLGLGSGLSCAESGSTRANATMEVDPRSALQAYTALAKPSAALSLADAYGLVCGDVVGLVSTCAPPLVYQVPCVPPPGGNTAGSGEADSTDT
eukprot:349785-Chlamydomonas_euryale.AAC.1